MVGCRHWRSSMLCRVKTVFVIFSVPLLQFWSYTVSYGNLFIFSCLIIIRQVSLQNSGNTCVLKYLELSMLSEYSPHIQFLPLHQNGKHGLHGCLHFVSFCQIAFPLALILVFSIIFWVGPPLFTFKNSYNLMHYLRDHEIRFIIDP